MPRLTANAWLRFDSIERALAVVRPTSILEFGAGQGALGQWLARSYEYTGVEPDDVSRAVATARLGEVGAGRIVADVDAVGDQRFDLVCAFEVLEHIEDDVGALQEWHGHLRPGGSVLLSVPAHERRFGPSDELAGHFRRYERDVLQSRLERAGFARVEIRSHGAGLGYALEAARHQLARRSARADSLSDRTSASGRYFQPTGTAGVLACATVAAPFRVIQRPFATGDRGTGYTALASVPS